jgi:hypothetical protein
MSDVQRRRLERLAATGDSEALTSLIRMLERQCAWTALCELGEHTYGGPVVLPTRSYVGCAYCDAAPRWLKLRTLAADGGPTGPYSGGTPADQTRF